VIKWKLKPPRAEILILTKSNRWKVMLNEEPQDDITMNMTPTEIRGVKIILLDLDQNTSSEAEPIYGIKKIEVHRPGKALALDSCNAQGTDSKIMNRFKIEEVQYINVVYAIPYSMAEDYMEDQYSSSVSNIRKFLEKIPSFK
jgi:hypothetical protein